MESQELLAKSHALLRAEARFWGIAAAGSRVVSMPGVVASIVPVTPDRSMFNWIVPDGCDALRRSYSELASLYASAGVRAFTVMVAPGDAASATFLGEMGHKLDSRPVAMAAPMTEIALEEPGDLAWSETRDLALIASLNDRAYGFPPPAFSAALTRWPDDAGWRGYVARLNGEPVACVMTYEAEGDCGVTGVASLPEARGRGMAARLLSRALHEARGRGATTTSLQASPSGRPIYAKLGYRDLGEHGMWEHRVAPP